MSVERDSTGAWSYMFGGSSSLSTSGDLLNYSLTNPALFVGLDVKTSILSQGKFIVRDIKTRKEIENDPFLAKIKNPNPFQSEKDFLKQLYWFKHLGTNVMRTIKIRDSGRADDIKNVKSFNNLVPSCVNWKDVNKISRMIVSDKDYNDLLKKEIEYKIGDRTFNIKIEDLEFFYDISNGMTNDSIFKSESRLNSVLNEIQNIQEAQKAKNINLQFSGKFLAVNKTNNGGYAQDFRDGERFEISNAFNKSGIIPTGADIDLKSLANNMNQLMLDDSISNDASRIFSVLGMDRDIINWYATGATTYDNKKVSIPSWIQNTIQSEANDVANTFSNSLKYPEQGKEIVVSFNHLPSMQAVEVERMEFINKQAEIIKTLVDSGVTVESAVNMLGITDLKYRTNEGK